jgi:Trypsin-like peptidase domain
MATIARPSVQSLFLRMRFQGTALATGTGFVVESRNGPHLVTCRHNLTGRHQETGDLLSKNCAVPDEVEIAHNNINGPGAWTTVVEQLFADGEPRWKEHPDLGARADFVALPLKRLANVKIYPFDPANPGSPIAVGPADAVSVVGFPYSLTAGGYFGIWATGFLASEPEYNWNGLPTMLIDCRTRQGQSGSPVVAYRSGGIIPTVDGGVTMFSSGAMRFLGLYSGRVNSDSDIGLVWKASSIQELVATL